MGESSRKHTIQAMDYLWFDTLSHTYSDKEQKVEQKDAKNVRFGKERNENKFKVV